MAGVNASLRLRTRAAITAAAAEVFRTKGFEGASMEDIARGAQVARGTLYYNFQSKDDIAVAIAETYRIKGYERLVERRAAGADAVTLLGEFFTFAGEWIAQNRDAAFVGTTAAIRGVGRSPDRPGTTSVFEQLVVQGQGEGVFESDLDPAVAARLLAALLTQAALLGPDASHTDAVTWPRQLLSLALQGLLRERSAPISTPLAEPGQAGSPDTAASSAKEGEP